MGDCAKWADRSKSVLPTGHRISNLPVNFFGDYRSNQATYLSVIMKFFWFSILAIAVAAAGAIAQTEKQLEQGRALAQALDLERPNWLYADKDVCPADLYETRDQLDLISNDDCAADQELCFRLCKGGNGMACLRIAYVVQASEGVPNSVDRPDQALFQRACSLGAAEGCTNAAAGLRNVLRDDDLPSTPCIAQSFEIACEQEGQWGCFMHAQEMILGEGRNQDLEGSIEVLGKVCALGNDARACEYANNWLEYLEEVEREDGSFDNIRID